MIQSPASLSDLMLHDSEKQMLREAWQFSNPPLWLVTFKEALIYSKFNSVWSSKGLAVQVGKWMRPALR